MGSNRMFSGMLGLEMPLHQNPNPHYHQQPQNPNPIHHNPQMVASYVRQNPQPQQSAKQQVTVSDDDEPGCAADGRKKVSLWHRMKWTDNMVRLLIVAVYYIGDEGGPGTEASDGKKKGVVSVGFLLQKQGKWKSVSREMMEKGFYVSPQQCEDKFNDLNKRYKRVNDILGKGTACLVVENQGLLEGMDLSPKMKEEARKLLSSKHLFFREMCAYHNSCGHDSAPQATQQSPEGAPEKGISSEEDDDEDEDDPSEGLRGKCRREHDDEDENDERYSRKRWQSPSPSQSLQRLSDEVASVLQDGARSQWEKKQWMRARLMGLEEEDMRYQCEALEIEKQRLKWIKFSSEKEREIERAKHENERRRIENERMVVVVRKREVELLDLLHQQKHQLSSNRKAEPSSITG